jgi:surface antigen
MRRSTMRSTCALTCSLLMLVCAISAGFPASSQADPPPWAKAHGWRAKHHESHARHDPSYVGYDGHHWANDYGILSGRCNRSAIGAVLGGSVGGVLGSVIGKGDGRAVAIVVGTVAGAVIGSQIGRSIDEEDRGCIGHSLELAHIGQTIRWTNPDIGVTFALTPTKDFEYHGHECREFTGRTTHGSSTRPIDGKACRSDDGSWRLL